MRTKHYHDGFELYKGLLNSLPVGAALIGMHGGILIWNKKASELFKKNDPNVIGNFLTDLFPQKDRNKIQKFISQSFAISKKSHTMILTLDTDNERFIQITSSQIIKDDINKGLIVVFQDVTRKMIAEKKRRIAEKTLKEREEQYRTLVELAPDMIYSISIDKKFSALNPAFEEITGWKITDWIGKSFVDTIHPDDISISLEKFKEGLSGKDSKRYELRIKTKNGEYVVLEFKSKPKIENGKIVGKFGIGRDITERKELEKRKDDLISIATHELKTPLTTIKAFTQIILKRLQTCGDQKAIAYLSKVDGQLNRLADLIKDLLEVGRINAGRLLLQKDTFDIYKLIEETSLDLQEISATHKIILNKTKTTIINADKNRIEQVLINLITNAIKYSPSADKIIIDTLKNGKYITVSIQDFGIGISKENWGKIFDQFVQIKEAGKEVLPSLGLGLYISSEIIKKHGGNIWLKSEKSKGSTFFFTLPVYNNKPKGEIIKYE